MKSYTKHVCSALEWSYNVYIMYLSSVNVSYEDSDEKAHMARHTSAFTGFVYNKYQMLDLLKDLRAGHLITIFYSNLIMNEGDIV